MAETRSIVATRFHVNLLEPKREAEALRAGEAITVTLEDGGEVRLDPKNEKSPGFARVLTGLEELGRPVYLEVDPETSAVTRLLVPNVGRIVRLRRSDKGIEVLLDSSHARHLLPRDASIFDRAEADLERAKEAGTPVILTDDDSQRIVDLRIHEGELPPGSSPAGGPSDRSAAAKVGFLDRFLDLPIWPWRWWWFRCVSRRRAQEIFDAMKAQTCNPAGIAAPCIPFLYPDDGCWGRAHEMCRLMLNMGVRPRKVWIDGWLETPTRNNPNCVVYWGWHVAPTICVYHRWWWFPLFWLRSTRMVIDPSLFDAPVSKATWKSVQGDPNATLTDTDWTVFHLWSNSTDPTFVQTNSVLATYRLALQNRVNQVGPPPYAHCP